MSEGDEEGQGQQPTLGHILTPARYQLLLVAQKQKAEAKQKNQNGQKNSRSTKNFRLSLYNIYIIYIYVCIWVCIFYLLAWAQAVSQVQNYVKVVAHEK